MTKDLIVKIEAKDIHVNVSEHNPTDVIEKLLKVADEVCDSAEVEARYILDPSDRA